MLGYGNNSHNCPICNIRKKEGTKKLKSFKIELLHQSKEDESLMSQKDFTTELLQIEDVLVENITTFPDKQIISISLVKQAQICPHCSSITNKVHDYRKQKIKDLSNFALPTELFLKRRRYTCTTCGKHFSEENSFVGKYQRTTSRMNRAILASLSEKRSFKSIALQCGCSVNKVMRINDKISYPKPKLPMVLSIDEFKGNLDNVKFQCIVADAENKKTLDILPNRDPETLTAYFNSFSHEERNVVKYVVIDMSTTFRKLIKTCFPNAKIVVDKFHLVRLIQWGLEDIRKMVQKSFHQYRRKYFKKSRFILLKRRIKLSQAEQEQLAIMLSVSDKLCQGYSLKERFFEIIDCNDATQIKKLLGDWCEYALKLNIPKFNTIVTTINKWYKEIFTMLVTPYNNGYTEGCNNRAKVLKRISFGLRNFERFRNRLLYIANNT